MAGKVGMTLNRERPKQFARELYKQRTGKSRYEKSETQIALSLNYSPSVARNPVQVKATKAYKEEIATIQEQLEKERQRVLFAMSKKNLSQVKYSQLSDVLKNLTHDIQLIGGNATERTENEASIQLAGLLNDIRQIASENKMKEAATVQDAPVEPLESPKIELGEAEEVRLVPDTTEE